MCERERETSVRAILVGISSSSSASACIEVGTAAALRDACELDPPPPAAAASPCTRLLPELRLLSPLRLLDEANISLLFSVFCLLLVLLVGRYLGSILFLVFFFSGRGRGGKRGSLRAWKVLFF